LFCSFNPRFHRGLLSAAPPALGAAKMRWTGFPGTHTVDDMKRITCCLFAVVAFSTLSFSSKAAVNNEFKIRFGIIERDKAGNIFISEETTNITFKLAATGFRFGCEITPPNQSPYTYYTITHLPASPKVVTGKFFDSNQEPVKDLVSKVANISSGPFFDSMHFDAGDPIGKYSHDIFINGKFSKTITFIVRRN
jgi:hypothetical protein